MVFDITMKKQQILLTIHKEFFKHKLLDSFVSGNQLTKNLNWKFIATETEFGFDGCIKQIREDERYRYFAFDFPKQSEDKERKGKIISVNGLDWELLRKFFVTTHLMNRYILEDMNHKKIPSVREWKDQSISFIISFENGRDIGGAMYAWAESKLAGLSSDSLEKLRQYVHAEISRFCRYFWGVEIDNEEVSFSNNSWLIKCSMNGRWINWKSGSVLNQFGSHNVDNSTDQALCFAGIVAMNTWLREN